VHVHDQSRRAAPREDHPLRGGRPATITGTEEGRSFYRVGTSILSALIAMCRDSLTPKPGS
jgi:hypothetical protein